MNTSIHCYSITSVLEESLRMLQELLVISIALLIFTVLVAAAIYAVCKIRECEWYCKCS